MKLLVHGRFYPSVGGVETVLRLLAAEWHRTGEKVVIASDVTCEEPKPGLFPFAVEYRPNPRKWLQLIRWADVFVHMNLSLKALWPCIMVRKPLVLVHHGFYYSDWAWGPRNLRGRIKVRLLSRATNIAVSRAVASRLPTECEVIQNPFDDCVFHNAGRAPNNGNELIFVGRLVSEKGVDLLLCALRHVRACGLRPRLTIVGDGPDRASLEGLATRLGLKEQIVFKGMCSSQQVANLLRAHELLVIPSVYEEGFGVVAVEGLACGCVVLGSDGGGLPEAIGPTGLTFRRGDARDLASKLRYLLQHREAFESYRRAVPVHLERHRSPNVARRYLTVLRNVAKSEIGNPKHIPIAETLEQ